MQLKYKIIIGIASLLAAFAFGRYSVSQPKVVTKETIATDDKKKEDTQTHTVTKTVIVEAPGGAKTTTTVVDTQVNDKVQDDDLTHETLSQTVTPAKVGTLNVSALASTNVNNPSAGLAYGMSVTKAFIGPINAGLWGLNNGTLGVSIGINF
jgi:hypothetical protein